MSRRALLGLAAAGVYLLTAGLSFRAGLLPVRPIYEGTAPQQPYRWVDPPKERVADNIPPEPGSTEFGFTPTGSEAANVNTGDGQAALILPPDAIIEIPDETRVRAGISPVDPATIGKPPKGFAYDGNAYSFTAVYANSGRTVALTARSCPVDATGSSPASKCPTILLHFPTTSTEVMRREGDRWVRLEGVKAVPQTQQIFGDTTTLGIFVAVKLPARGDSKRTDLLAIGLGLAAILGGAVFARVRVGQRAKQEAERKKARQRRKRP